MIKQDPLTGEEFYPIRENQRFASRQNQIKYNNLLAKEKREQQALFLKQLNANQSILEACLDGEDKAIVNRSILMQEGYDFRFMTHQAQEGENIFNFCFQYGISQINAEEYIIKKQTWKL